MGTSEIAAESRDLGEISRKRGRRKTTHLLVWHEPV